MDNGIITLICLIIICPLLYFLRNWWKARNRVQEDLLLDDNNMNVVFDIESNIESEDLIPENLEIESNPVKHANYISNSEDECSICLDSVLNQEIIQFECLHKYHKECINDWINQRKNNIICPECGI